MNVPEQVAKLCQALPRHKQVEVVDFVEFLLSRPPRLCRGAPPCPTRSFAQAPWHSQ
jgi:hypothetical protein